MAHSLHRGRPSPRSLLYIAAGLALGISLLAVAARGIELNAIATGLAQVDPAWVGLAFLTVLATTATKTLRWRSLFLHGQRPNLPSLTNALLVGQLLNAVLPARLGDIGRAYAVSAKQEHNTATVIGTVVVEKTFDVLMLTMCAAATAATTPLPRWVDFSLLGVAAAGVLLIALVALTPDKKITSLTGVWTHRLPWSLADRTRAALLQAKAGLAALRTPSMALVGLAWTFLVWTLAASTNYVLFLAFDLQLSFGAALMLLVLLHIGVAPPSSPGRLGVFHALTVAGMSVLGVEQSLGLVYATVLHALVYLPQILPGALLLMLRRVSISPSPNGIQAHAASEVADGMG